MAFDKNNYPTDLTLQPDDLPEGGNTAPMSDPASKPPPSSGQTSDKRRDPDSPPSTAGYEDDVPTRPRGGAKGRTETKAPVVEKTTNEEIENLRKEVQRLKTLMGETPEGRRQAESERRAQERVDALTTTEPFGDEFGRPRTKGEIQDLNPFLIPMKISEVLGGPEFDMPTERYRQQARQSTGGFIQEARPPAEPRLRSTGEIITPEMSIKRLNDRIREKKSQKTELQKKEYGQYKQSLRGPELRAAGIFSEDPSAEGESYQDAINRGPREALRMREKTQYEIDQVQREINALVRLRKEIEQSVAGDAAE